MVKKKYRGEVNGGPHPERAPFAATGQRLALWILRGLSIPFVLERLASDEISFQVLHSFKVGQAANVSCHCEAIATARPWQPLTLHLLFAGGKVLRALMRCAVRACAKDCQGFLGLATRDSQ